MSNRSAIKKLFRSSACLLLAIMMVLSMSTIAFADNGDDAETPVAESQEEGSYLDANRNDTADSSETESYLTGFVRDNLYSGYYDEHLAYDTVLPSIEVDGNSYASATATIKNAAQYEGASSVAVFSSIGKVKYNVDIAEEGMYAIRFNYYPIADKNGNDIEIAIAVDGKTPFEEAAALNLKRVWVNELIDGKISTDSIGNELLPNQIERPRWVAKDLYDAEGRYLDAFKFYFTPGTHEITLTLENGLFALDSMVLHNEGPMINYDQYLSDAYAAGAQDNALKLEPIEAEQFIDKSDSIIQMTFDRSDAKITPYSISKTVFNTIGGTNWQKSGNRVNWEIEVPEDGLYELSFRYRQSYQRGKSSYRTLYIDDVIPFEEAKCIKFDYKTGYRYVVAGRKNEDGKKEDYKFYLTAGKHVLSLEASIGEL